jgi:hypothetical protein
MTTYVTSIKLSAGDVVCFDTANPGKVTLATPTALVSARAVLGVATAAAAKNASVIIADSGTVPTTATRLGAGARSMVGVTAGGRCTRLATPAPADYLVGVVDEAGELTIQVHCELETSISRMFNVRDFGARGDGRTDDLPAFCAAIAAMGDRFIPDGGVLYVPPGRYKMSGPLHISQSIRLQGAHGGGWYAGSVLEFPSGSGGVVVEYSQTTSGPRGDWSTLSEIGIFQSNAAPPRWQGWHRYAVNDIVVPTVFIQWGFAFRATAVTGDSDASEPTWPTDPPSGTWTVRDGGVKWELINAHGLTLKAQAYCEKLFIRGFPGNGVHIEASLPEASASAFNLADSVIEFSGGSGVFVQGGDANGGYARNLQFTHCRGYAVYDTPFFANTYIGLMTHACESGSYYSNKSSFVGCYAEIGQPPAVITGSAQWIGGTPGEGFTNLYMPAWSAGRAVKADGLHFTRPSTPNGFVYRCSGPGTTVSEPSSTAWPRTFGEKVAESGPGGPTWLCYAVDTPSEGQIILDGNNNGPAHYRSTMGPTWFAFEAGFRDSGQRAFGWHRQVPGDPTEYDNCAVHWDDTFKRWAFGFFNNPGACPVAFTSAGALEGYGYATFPRGLHLDRDGYPGGFPIKVIAGSAPPNDSRHGWTRGSVVFNTGASPSGFVGWVCTTEGTPGTYAEGLRATVASPGPSTTVTLSGTNTELRAGQYITIGGTGPNRIVSVSGITMVMTSAVAAGAGQAIAYSNPVFKTFGAISA